MAVVVQLMTTTDAVASIAGAAEVLRYGAALGFL